MQNPSLWSSIYIHILNEYSSPTLGLILEMLLARSGESALSIHISERWAELHDSDLALLTEHSHRWKDVSFRPSVICPAETVISKMMFIQRPLPILESLVLTSYTPAETLVFDAFQAAPNLHTFNSAFGNPASVILPWSQLQYLTLQTPGTAEILDMMARCPNLLTVTLKEVRELEEESHPEPATSDACHIMPSLFHLPCRDGFDIGYHV